MGRLNACTMHKNIGENTVSDSKIARFEPRKIVNTVRGPLNIVMSFIRPYTIYDEGKIYAY